MGRENNVKPKGTTEQMQDREGGELKTKMETQTPRALSHKCALHCTSIFPLVKLGS